jgi:hypothetical protein
MSVVEQEVVFAAPGDKGWNRQDCASGFGKPSVAEGSADGLIGKVPAGKIGGLETFHRKVGGDFNGEDGVSAGQAA